MSLPILDLSYADDLSRRPLLLSQLHDALFNIGFLYIKNHGVPSEIVTNLERRLPALFDLPQEIKANISKINSPHFLGYSGFAEETTLGKKDLREQFDFATELPEVWQISKHMVGPGAYGGDQSRDFSRLFWRLRGPNQWPPEDLVPGFRDALTNYHNALQELSYRFVHLVEEAFGIPVGTFDNLFQPRSEAAQDYLKRDYLPPQHRIKLVKYPPISGSEADQGVGPHKDSSGWLTFLKQVGVEEGLEVLSKDGKWIAAPPIPDTFVVNFGNAFEAATEGAVRATIHRVKIPCSTNPRYSIPFFQGLPLDMTVSEIQSLMPESVRNMRRLESHTADSRETSEVVSTFTDPRWDSLGESQLRKWIRSHQDVALKWYGADVVKFYLS